MKNSKLLIFVFGFLIGSLSSTSMACFFINRMKNDMEHHMKLTYETHRELMNMMIKQNLRVDIEKIKKKSK